MNNIDSMTIDEISILLKEKVKQIQNDKKNIDLLDNSFNVKDTIKSSQIHENKFYDFAFKIGKYLQKKGFNKLIDFVRCYIPIHKIYYVYTYEDFIKYDDDKFIINIYNKLLNREPTIEELENRLSQLRTKKLNKIQIISFIYFSKEVFRQNVKILGAKKRLIYSCFLTIPLLGKTTIFFKNLFLISKKFDQIFLILEALQAKINHLEIELNKKDNEILEALQAKINHLEIELNKKTISPEIDTFFKIESKDFFKDAKDKLNLDFSDKLICFSNKELYYSLFESTFYNSEVVIQKQKIYLDYMPLINTKENPHLDIGCGRGEFLEILKNENFEIQGIDINSLEINNLKKQGFNVETIDMIDFLSQTNQIFSSISALQVIEHIDYQTLKEFIELAYSKLLLNGVIILETINPHNYLALNSFYMDETHKRPLPPELVSFILQFAGFKEVKFLYSNPMPHEFRSKTDMRINYHDYAVIGIKK